MLGEKDDVNYPLLYTNFNATNTIVELTVNRWRSVLKYSRAQNNLATAKKNYVFRGRIRLPPSGEQELRGKNEKGIS